VSDSPPSELSPFSQFHLSKTGPPLAWATQEKRQKKEVCL
jgi:hypothetical protein